MGSCIRSAGAHIGRHGICQYKYKDVKQKLFSLFLYSRNGTIINLYSILVNVYFLFSADTPLLQCCHSQFHQSVAAANSRRLRFVRIPTDSTCNNQQLDGKKQLLNLGHKKMHENAIANTAHDAQKSMLTEIKWIDEYIFLI